jgi:uncharacterized repeat protein (TIGR04076 family)
MTKVKITVTKSKCRSGYHKVGDSFIVEDLCPPICHELWNGAYPMIYALQNGGTLDYDNDKASVFDLQCPDGGRVKIHGERIED